MIHRLAFIAALLAAPSLHAEDAWRVDPDFGKKSREDISGAACSDRRCIAVNDETHYAQEFKLKKRRVKPGKRIRLLDKGEELDAEAIAEVDGVFYIAGSHGAPRKSHEIDDAVFNLFRVDGDQFEPTTRLGAVIAATPALADYAGQPLNQNGVNIEGLAAIGDRLYFGFRGPSVKGDAYVLEASAKALFLDAPLDPTLHTIPLGDRIGIRDMAAVEDGILILTGPVNTLPRRYTVVQWNPDTNKTTPLMQVPLPGKGKPEGLMVLDETNMSFEVLILHDGPANGEPVSLSIRKR